MVCSQFNSYFVSRGAYINTPYANLYYNYLVKHERYEEIENLLHKGLLDMSSHIARNKKGSILHICEKDCPCIEDPLFTQTINRIVIGVNQLVLRFAMRGRKGKSLSC